MLFIYRIFLRILYLTLYIPGRIKAARGNRAWAERLGFSVPDKPADLWLHAASVGEVKLMSYLITHLRTKQNGLKIHLTVMTEAGFQTARDALGDSVSISTFPLDLPGIMERTLRSLEAKALVLAEVEIWPNLLARARKRGLPVILVNARMSEKSFLKYARFRRTMNFLLEHYTRFFFKSADDARRYADLGVPGDKSVVAGDLKFDAPLYKSSPADVRALRRVLAGAGENSRAGENDFIFVAGSTRPDEERILARTLKNLAEQGISLRMVIAPRHLGRLDEIKKILLEEGFRSLVFEGLDRPFEVTGADGAFDSSIILVNRMGILQALYAAGDLCFVGGTMSDTGGHNILEPVFCGSPVLFGPDTRNIGDLADFILEGDYGARAQNPAELAKIVEAFYKKQREFRILSVGARKDSAAALAGDFILKQAGFSR